MRSFLFPVKGIKIKVNTDLFPECGFRLSFQIIEKFSYPSLIFIVLLMAADEDLSTEASAKVDIVIMSLDYA
jgi:hypothetical protein